MEIDKHEVVSMLRSQGAHDKAQQAQCALPRRIDTEQDAGLLHQFEINTGDLAEEDPIVTS